MQFVSQTHSKDLSRPQNKTHISMATTALSRNPTFGCIYRSLATKINLLQLRSTNPPFRPFHGFPPQSLLRPPLPQPEIHLDRGFQSYLHIYRRFLCSSTSTATVSQASSSTSGSSEGTSGKGDKSDQSQNTSEQGKSVRGGVFFFSLLSDIYYLRNEQLYAMLFP